MSESDIAHGKNTVRGAWMHLVMRFQGWIQDMNGNIERRGGLKAQLLAPSEQMSPTLRQRITEIFDHVEQAARPLALAECLAKGVRTMACSQLTPSEIMTFFLERRSGRYFTVLFENEDGGQRGKLLVNDISQRFRVGGTVTCQVIDRSRMQGEQLRYIFEPLDLIPSYPV